MNKMNEFEATVFDLNPDVIGITETWATGEVNDAELSIKGNDMFRCDRPVDFKCGGVLLYTKEELEARKFEPKTGFPEQVWRKVFDNRKKRAESGCTVQDTE